MVPDLFEKESQYGLTPNGLQTRIPIGILGDWVTERSCWIHEHGGGLMADTSVVVVGAGIAGLSTSFHLVEKGAGPITLVDKGRVGSGSSSRAGGLSTMLMGTEATSTARGISFDIFERFDRILDDYRFHQVGCLGLYDPDQFRAASQLHEMHRSCGARFEVLRRRELEARFPELRLRDDEYGVLDLRGGYNEPDSYIPALTAKVRESGVQIREHCTVEDFLIEGHRMQGVRLRGGEELRAQATVCTVNAWANTLLSLVGQPLPVRNFVHERFVTLPFAEAPRLPATNDDALGVYYRPTEDNRILLGTESLNPVQVARPGFDFDLVELEPTTASLPFIRQALQERLPRMKDADFDYHRVGLISYPIDMVPNIGPVGALPGLYLGSSFCSGGFGYHPVAGLLLSEYIVDGQTQIDVSTFSPDRFKDFDTEGYLAQDISHQEMIDAHAVRSQGVVRKRH